MAGLGSHRNGLALHRLRDALIRRAMTPQERIARLRVHLSMHHINGTMHDELWLLDVAEAALRVDRVVDDGRVSTNPRIKDDTISAAVVALHERLYGT